MATQSIRIHAAAPAKPPMAAACNGCGVCCLSEPCPLGMLLSMKTSGPCRAVRWIEADQRYVCGALSARLPLLRTFVARAIAANQGCDCDDVVVN